MEEILELVFEEGPAVVLAAADVVVARGGRGRGNTYVPSRAMGASRGSVGCKRNRLGSGWGNGHGGGAVVVVEVVAVDMNSADVLRTLVFTFTELFSGAPAPSAEFVSDGWTATAEGCWGREGGFGRMDGSTIDTASGRRPEMRFPQFTRAPKYLQTKLSICTRIILYILKR